MAISSQDKLIRRKQPKSILTLRIFMIICAITLSAILIDISASSELSYLKIAGSSILSIFLIAMSWYIGKIMQVEYKYTLEDGVLHIERCFMYYFCKEVFNLSFKKMHLVCLEKSAEDMDRKNFKTVDLSSKNKEIAKTVIYFQDEKYGKARLLFEPNDEIKRLLELFLREKVHL